MRSLSKMSSEPNLTKPRGSKSFVPVKCSSTATGPTASYKLSPKVKHILSKEITIAGGLTGGVYSDDSSLQSTNTRRRFQRRGSKSPSMFKALSLGNLGETLLKDEQQLLSSQHQHQHQHQQDQQPNSFFMINSMNQIPTDSVRSCLTTFGESTTTFSSDMEENENLEFGVDS